MVAVVVLKWPANLDVRETRGGGEMDKLRVRLFVVLQEVERMVYFWGDCLHDRPISICLVGGSGFRL